MKKYGATRPLDSRALIVIGRDKQVIGRVFAPKRFMAGGEGQADLAVIVFMALSIAPAIMLA